MIEDSALQTQAVAEPTPEPGARGLGWFLGGFVLPLGSRMFYRIALRKPLWLPILFYLLFCTLVALVTTVVVVRGLAAGGQSIAQAYASGTMPAITIRNGLAEVDARQPYYLLDQPRSSSDGVLIAIDTTGRLNDIDPARYDVGFLLTRSELKTLNESGRYQSIPLQQLNEMFGQDPLVIDAASTASAWSMIAAVSTAVAFFGLLFWHFIVGLLMLAMLALVVWALTLLFRRGTRYDTVLIAGLYAAVPAFYIAHILSRSGVSFVFLRTLLLIPLWALALALGLRASPPAEPRLWTAFIGLPLLAMLVVELFMPIPEPWGPVILWALLALTVIALVVVRLLLKPRESASPSLSA